MFKTLITHPKMLLAAMLGRPYQNAPPPVKTHDPEDPLFADLQKAEGVLKGITAKLSEKAPVVKLNSHTFKKFLPFGVGIFVVIAILLFISIVLPRIRTMGNDQVEPIIVQTESPTPIEYIPSQPSVYANDPEVMKLDEDLNVLDREIAGTQLREPTLNSPILDFNISF